MQNWTGKTIFAEKMIGESVPYFWAEVSEDGKTVELVWEESLTFHLNNYWLMVAPLVDDERELTPRGADAVAQAVRQCFDDEGRSELSAQITLDRDMGVMDGPGFTVTATLGLSDGPATTLDTLLALAWPFYGVMTNITDPGTFGSDYVFRLAGEILEGLSDGETH